MHIIAGDPIAADDELVRSANAQELSVVLVELWPQADWTRLFVLTPFVVECEAGHGFPVREIADRIAEATQDSGLLASAVPAIADSARAGIVKQSLIRSALLGITGARSGASRPLISLEQIRMVSRLPGRGVRARGCSGTFRDRCQRGGRALLGLCISVDRSLGAEGSSCPDRARSRGGRRDVPAREGTDVAEARLRKS